MRSFTALILLAAALSAPPLAVDGAKGSLGAPEPPRSESEELDQELGLWSPEPSKAQAKAPQAPAREPL